MRIAWLWFPCAIALLGTANAQVTSGTIVVLSFASDKIVVAADSRGRQVGHPPTDDHCKIAVFDNSIVFAATGAVEHHKEHALEFGADWTNISEVGLAAHGVPGKNGVRLKAIAETWAQQLKKHWTEYNFYYPHKTAEAADRGILTQGFFASVEQGQFVEEVELITFEGSPPVVDARSSNQLVSCTECKAGSCTRFCGLGKAEVFDQVKNDPVRPSPELAARVAADTLHAISLADMVGAAAPQDVGGFIDAVELWKDGSIHWAARKPSCPQSND
jgi:hypothetical protein